MNDLITKEQEDLIRDAGKKLKEAFPTSNLQFCFNLTQKHSNVNYNIKSSGIVNESRT